VLFFKTLILNLSFYDVNSLPLLLGVGEFQLFQKRLVSPLDLVASTAVVVQKFLDVYFWEL